VRDYLVPAKKPPTTFPRRDGAMLERERIMSPP
jgi:hypothetical protein